MFAHAENDSGFIIFMGAGKVFASLIHDYPMIQSGQAENVNLHVYRFASYFFKKYKYSCIYESPTSPNFTPINSIFHSHNLCHASILDYSSPIVVESALLILLQYLLISLPRTKL